MFQIITTVNAHFLFRVYLIFPKHELHLMDYSVAKVGFFLMEATRALMCQCIGSPETLYLAKIPVEALT